MPSIKEYFYSFIFVTLVLIVISCEPPSLGFQYVSFNNIKYQNYFTQYEEINVYKNRLDIGAKYVEMGVMIMENKVSGDDINKLKKEAYNLSADGIILEGKNIVLIKLIEREAIKDANEKDSSI